MTSTGVPRAAWAVVALLVAGAGAGGALSGDDDRVVSVVTVAPTAPPTASTAPPAEPVPAELSFVERAELAAVRLEHPCPDDVPCPFGSGSIVDSRGLILTNAHVAAPNALGLARQYGPTDDVEDPPYLVVALPSAPDAPAERLYRASVVAVDGYLDLAVLRVDATVDGGPLSTSLSLPNVPLGSLAEADKDDEIRVIGYPSTGDSLSPTVRRGTIASKPEDPEGNVDGPWELNTDVPIHGGNSGGLVVDEQGRLVAVPAYSQSNDRDEEVYRARAVELARALVEAAQRDVPYRSQYVVERTGQEQVDEVLWSSGPAFDCIEPDDAVVSPAPQLLAVQVRLSGTADGEDVRLIVTDEDGTVVRSRSTYWTNGAEEDCLYMMWLLEDEESLVPPGTYTLSVLAGADGEEIGRSTTKVVAG